MNRSIRNLVIAVPLATAGLTMVNVTAATAGPDIIAIPDDPQPPKGPGDIAIPTPPKPPKGPQDLADAPKPKKPAPKPQAQPQGGNQTSTAPTTQAEKKTVKGVEVVSAHGSADSIDRSDALFVAGPAETELTADTTDNGGMDLTWLLLGGGVVTASGIAFAARKRTNA